MLDLVAMSTPWRLWRKHGARSVTVFVVTVLVLVAAYPARADGRRVALIVGNVDYESLPKLVNSVNDSIKVRDTLRDAGFETFYGANLKRIELEGLIQKFFRSVDNADVAIVYYSGHGVQVAGDNFIVPVDTRLTTPYDIEQQTIKVADIFNYMSAHSHAQLIFLDACRNNPFKIDRFWIGDTLQNTDKTEGLARTTYGVGSLIAFSTEPGAVAYDGVGNLSPYTSALVRHLTAPNEEIRRALTLVRREVIAATDGRQVPWENSALVDDLYLMPAPPAPSAPAMLRVTAQAGTHDAPLHLPAPRRSSDEGLAIKIEQLPDQGRLRLDGKDVEAMQSMGAAEFSRLTFDASGLSRGAIALLAYSVTDKWSQTARGVAAITVDNLNASPTVVADAASAVRNWFRGYGGREVVTPVGVGPVPLGFDAPTAGVAPADAFVSMATAPEFGVLKLGARSVVKGEHIAVADLPKLAYEPAIGSEAHKDVLSLGLSVPDALISISIRPELDPCDVEAAAPLDLQGVSRGKLPNEIDVKKGLAACQASVARYPTAPRFQYQLGRVLMAAGRNADAKVAIESAASRGHTRAIWQQGNFESLGVFGPVNPTKANEFYRRCSDLGDAYCEYALGEALYYGTAIGTDKKRGLALMLRASGLGHTYAMNELGSIFLYGSGTDAEKERGLRFFEAGAERDDIYSYNNLGLVYLRGMGRPADPAKALNFFSRAAAGGNPYAPLNLGRMARDGIGGPRDLAAAAKWFEMSAERGNYWAALERARLPGVDNMTAALFFALAVGFNQQGSDFDKDRAAEAGLAKLPVAAKQQALSQLATRYGSATVAETGNLDQRLIDTQSRAWRARNPRFDLF